MRKYIYAWMMCLCAVCTYAQYDMGNPPLNSWSKENIWPTTQITRSGLIPANESGEDWFYNGKIRYNSNHDPIGYVFGGYATEPRVNTFSYNSNDLKFNPIDIYNYGGCGDPSFDNTDQCDLRMNIPNIQGGYHNITNGILTPLFGLSDLNGNMTDVIMYPYNGVFAYVIPTSDGGYLGVGYLEVPAKINYSSSTNTITLNSLVYNPSTAGELPNGLANTFDKSVGITPCTTVTNKCFAMKIRADKTEEWSYVYGYNDDMTLAFSEGGGGFGGAVECDGGYLLVGGANNYGMVLKIGYAGNLLQKKTYSDARINKIERIVEGGQEYFYAGGEYMVADAGFYYKYFVSKLKSNILDPNPLWSSGHSEGVVITPDAAGTWVSMFNISVAKNGEVIVSGTSRDLPTRYGHIYRLSPLNGDILKHFTEDQINIASDDPRYVAIATSDGGCAVASTVIRYPVVCSFQLPQGYDPIITDIICNSKVPSQGNPYNYNTFKWNSDTYIAKFDENLNKIWSKSFDAPTATPSGSALDILKTNPCTVLQNWQIPNQLGLDVKKSECVFDILETHDGGLMAIGKTSLNLDDCYIVKLDCKSNAINLTNYSLTNNQQYTNYSIRTGDKYLAENNSKLTLEACKYVLIDKTTEFKKGSIVSASIGSQFCCSPTSGGARMASSDFLSDGTSGTFENTFASGNESLGDVKVSVFPNPNNGNFTISLESMQNQQVAMEVIDSYGRVIIPKKDYGTAGQQQTEISLPKGSKGVYLVKLSSGKNSMVKKVIVE